MTDSDVWKSVSASWNRIDPIGTVHVRRRDNGKVELLVTSTLFEGKDSSQREAIFWPAVRDLPRDILVRMTYSLLLTPQEADRYFTEEAGGRNGI